VSTPVLVDSSAWIEFLRRTGSETNQRVRGLVAGGYPIAVTEPIVFELLMGADSDAHAEELRRFLVSFDLRPFKGIRDAERAADIYRACRRVGRTIRSSVDCMVAAVALRDGLPVLSADRDFAAIADETGLELV
jgi:predicted nucleic acid-binding protein